MLVLDTDHFSLMERSAGPARQHLLRRLNTVPPLVRRVIEPALDNQTVYGVVSQTITSLRKMAEKN